MASVRIRRQMNRIVTQPAVVLMNGFWLWDTNAIAVVLVGVVNVLVGELVVGVPVKLVVKLPIEVDGSVLVVDSPDMDVANDDSATVIIWVLVCVTVNPVSVFSVADETEMCVAVGTSVPANPPWPPPPGVLIHEDEDVDLISAIVVAAAAEIETSVVLGIDVPAYAPWPPPPMISTHAEVVVVGILLFWRCGG